MMLRTHLVIALFVMILFISYVNYAFFFVIILFLATILPDLDSSFSKVSKKTAKIISFFTKHRGFLHSYTFCLIVSIFFAFFIPVMALPFFLGYSVHLFSDSFTKEGITPFWPLKKKTHWKVKVGGATEHSVFAAFIIMDIIAALFLLS